MFHAVFVAGLVHLCIHSLVFSQSNFTVPLLDKSEFEKRLLPSIKYHLYDPQLFHMYTQCLPILERPCYASKVYNGFIYALDINFLEAIVALNQSVSPSEATLFIIPVFYNQVTAPGNPCYHLDRKALVAQMYEVLLSLGHYIPGERNHFLMADHYASGLTPEWDKFTYKPELIIGRFEDPFISRPSPQIKIKNSSQFMNVGYATKHGVYRSCNLKHHLYLKYTPRPILDRKYLVSFTGGASFTPENTKYYLNRVLLFNSTQSQTVPNDIFISIYDKSNFNADKVNKIDGVRIVHNSLLSLTIRGDTPTTDRLWVAFEQLTLIGVISSEKEDLLPLLPFPRRVPWENIIVWIDSDAFTANPVAAIRNAALAMSDDEKERRYNLMKKHRRDVLWAYNESVALYNVLEDAIRLVKTLNLSTIE